MKLVTALASGLVTCAVGVCAAGGSPQAPERPPSSALPVELVGVVVDSDAPSRSACLVRCTYPEELRRTSIVEVGRTACDLAEIREVHENAVVIRNVLTNRTELLTFRKTAGSVDPPAPMAVPDQPAPRVVAAGPERVSVELRKGAVDHYLANLPDFLSSALATPRYRNTGGGLPAIEGFEISQIKPGSVVEKLGLRDGDVILEVSGERLDSLATVLRLLGQARATTETTLTVLRNGQRMTFAFRTK